MTNHNKQTSLSLKLPHGCIAEIAGKVARSIVEVDDLRDGLDDLASVAIAALSLDWVVSQPDGSQIRELGQLVHLMPLRNLVAVKLKWLKF